MKTDERLERVIKKLAVIDLKLKQLQKIMDEVWGEYENT